MRDHEPALICFAEEILHRVIATVKTFDDEWEKARRIHGGEWLEASVDFRDDAAILCQWGLHESGEKIRTHRRQVDREHDDVWIRDAWEHGFERSERASVGREVFDDGHAAFRIRTIGATGDEKLARSGGAEDGELATPERLTFDFQCCFIAAHARGAAASKQHGAK